VQQFLVQLSVQCLLCLFKEKMMTVRFNKTNVLIHIERTMESLEKKWGFNPDNGWSQVEGSPIERVVAYGEYNGLDELHSELSCNSLRG
jgi:hypothetical protein